MLWYKKSFERYVRTALRASPDLLAGIDWNAPKRETVDVVVDRLMEREGHFQDLILEFMLEVANRTDINEIDRIEDPSRAERARRSIAALKSVVEVYEPRFEYRRRMAAEEQEHRARRATQRRFEDELAALRSQFDAMHLVQDAQRRGKDFEVFLNRLFALFDFEPRLAYDLKHEQLDGAFSFDTDDYIVEARWRKELVSRGEADIFDSKVRRKGKNALGLIVSINGFTQDAIAQYASGTTFITMDGSDLMAVLTGGFRLEDVLKRKKRHMNEVGACYFPVNFF